MIPYGRQEITQDDINAVVGVLESDFLTQGPMVPEFEKCISNYCGADYAVAVNSATSALHLACLALDLGVGDWLWTSPITFVASANCGLYCGARVDFVDIDPITYNLSPHALKKKLIQAEKKNRLPKVVIPVHLSGQSCEMEEIHKLSQQYGFKIIEDASHAIGGKYQNQPIGSNKYSDITIFSFHPVKIITTGEGGAAVTNNRELHNKMRLLRSHGITRDHELMTQAPDGPWYYQQIELGYNYRMTDIQAALGISQMKRLDDYINRRHEIATKYNVLLDNLPITLPFQNTNTYTSYHLYIIRLNDDSIISHRDLFNKLQRHNVGVNLHYIPLYKQPHYKNNGISQDKYPNSEGYYEQAISLPIYPTLTTVEQDQVVNTLIEAIKETKYGRKK